MKDFSEVIKSYLEGQENKDLENWVNRSEENKQYLLQIKNEMELAEKGAINFKPDLTSAYEKINPSRSKLFIQPEKTKTRKMRFFTNVAAMVGLGFLVAFIGFSILNDQPDYIELSTSQNKKQEIILADGSSVFLNKGSKLYYPEEFKGEIREVKLMGEAFFNVTENPEKPFIINVGNSKIKVLGTSFNVRCYEDEEIDEVIVVSGKVACYNKDEGESSQILLTKGEQAIIHRSSPKMEKKVNYDPNLLAWKNEEIIFKNTLLSDVEQVLEHYYRVNVIIENEALYNCRLTSTFKNDDLEKILEVLKTASNISYTLEKDACILKGSGCQ
ncbi:FecR family protein [Flexithrix dorotheae]|uniref:FecR family protein n=1 Tax=Flexithrix dorotheae TaxID=70993 RepID=UPI000374C8F6|nr:FecR domain-containing protein [Flexithrix dorotheae]